MTQQTPKDEMPRHNYDDKKEDLDVEKSYAYYKQPDTASQPLWKRLNEAYPLTFTDNQLEAVAKQYQEKNGYSIEVAGLTKREYFAGIAMTGLIASYSGTDAMPNPKYIAKLSAEFSDALIEVLNTKPQ